MGSKLRFRAKEFTRNWSFDGNCDANPEIGIENLGLLEIRLTIVRLRGMALINSCCIMKLARNISYHYPHSES